MRKAILAILICIGLCMCTAALAQTGSVVMYDTEAVGIGGSTDITEITIPGNVTSFSDDFIADLNGCQNLQYIMLEATQFSDLKFQTFNLTGVSDLEAVYFNFEITENNLAEIKNKITVRSDVEFRQFHSIDSAYFSCDEPVYNNGQVSIRWNLVSNDAWYIVTRDQENGTSTEVFDSRVDPVHFHSRNGVCVFTEIISPTDQEQIYQYHIKVDAPFSSGIESTGFNLTIPAQVSTAVPAPIPAASHPVTGDDTPILMLCVLMACSAAVCVLSAIRMKKREI